MGVIRTLFDRMNSVVTETEDRTQEEKRVRAALKTCGYPDWAMDRVKNQMHNKNKDAENQDQRKVRPLRKRARAWWSSHRILYAGSGSSSSGRIVKYNLDNNEQVDIYNAGAYIYDVTLLGDYIIFVERNNGIKAIHKNGGALIPLSITGLQDCTEFWSIHSMNVSQVTTEHVETTIVATTEATTIEAATTEVTTEVTTEATTEATTGSITGATTEVTTGVTTEATTGATTTDEVTTEHEITTTQNMIPMKMDTTTTGVQSISAFENVASIFPYNATPGTITNNSDLVFYLFEHKNREEDLQFDSEGDLALTIPKEFLASGLHNGTGYLTVVIKKTPTDDTEYWGDDSGEVYHMLGSALVSINLFSINGTLRKHEDEYNPLNISFPIKVMSIIARVAQYKQ
ncbi:uncharacterized protein [Amphiura filiformis]|uniref:uncharacterized protein n=1 Tax=Amphiura filiformis TaxID=82378 RepID=UPI003B2285AF